MKRRGFLGLLAGLPFAPKALVEPKVEQLTFGSYDVTIPAPAITFNNDVNTGLYRPDSLSIAISGVFKKRKDEIAANVLSRNKLLESLRNRHV